MGQALGIVTAAVQVGLESIRVKPKRSIGGFTANATISEKHVDEMEITQHPVEEGAPITDHAFMRPAEVVITCMWSNSPQNANIISGLLGAVTGTIAGVSSLLTGNSPDQARDIYQRILALQRSRTRFDVFTAKRVYKDMLIKSLETETDKETANALKCTIHCQQIIVVQTQVVTVGAPAASQADPQSTLASATKGAKQLVDGARANLSAAVDSITPDPAKLLFH